MKDTRDPCMWSPGNPGFEMKQKTFRKKIFPVGIFLMLFLLEAIVAAGAISFYFYRTARTRIDEIDRYTRGYSTALAEACAGVAELSYRKKTYGSLTALFREKINQELIDEALFVLNDGTLVIHSRSEIEKELKGNIANDEFAYNIDLILAPARRNEKSAQFTQYNLAGKEIPLFPLPYGTPREHKQYIRQYIYPDINKTGWLVSRAVFDNKKAIGTVALIISKDRIYFFLDNLIRETLRLYRLAAYGSAALAFFVSLIVLIRYRGIQKKTMRLAAVATAEMTPPVMEDTSLPDILPEEIHDEKVEPAAAPDEAEATHPAAAQDNVIIEFLGYIDSPALPSGTNPADDGSGEKENIIIPVLHEDRVHTDRRRVILDAVPAGKR